MSQLDAILDNAQNYSGNKTANTGSLEKWKEEQAALRSHTYEMMDDATAEFTGSDESYRTFLDTKAQFLAYGIGNTLLIAWQNPEATAVKDFNGWKEAGARVDKQAAP